MSIDEDVNAGGEDIGLVEHQKVSRIIHANEGGPPERGDKSHTPIGRVRLTDDLEDQAIVFAGFVRRLVVMSRKGYANAIADAGLDPDITPHWHRHTCATWLMEQDVKPRLAAQYLGMTVRMLESATPITARATRARSALPCRSLAARTDAALARCRASGRGGQAGLRTGASRSRSVVRPLTVASAASKGMAELLIAAYSSAIAAAVDGPSPTAS